jgi:hypothetical protein
MKYLFILFMFLSTLSLHAGSVSAAQEYPEYLTGTNTVTEWFRRASAAPPGSERDVNTTVITVGKTTVVTVKTHNYPGLRNSTLYVYSSTGIGELLQFRALSRIPPLSNITTQEDKSGIFVQVVDPKGTVIFLLRHDAAKDRMEDANTSLNPTEGS